MKNWFRFGADTQAAVNGGHFVGRRGLPSFGWEAVRRYPFSGVRMIPAGVAPSLHDIRRLAARDARTRGLPIVRTRPGPAPAPPAPPRLVLPPGPVNWTLIGGPSVGPDDGGDLPTPARRTAQRRD